MNISHLNIIFLIGMLKLKKDFLIIITIIIIIIFNNNNNKN